MHTRKRPRASSLFLIELILAILIFSIASAICVQIFVTSHLLSRRSQQLTLAVNASSSIAEICRIADSLTEATQLLEQEYPLLHSSSTTNDRASLQFYFDEEAQPCKKGRADCTLSLLLTQEAQLLSAEIQVVNASDESILYELQALHHIPRGALNE